MSQKDDARANARMVLEQAIRDYVKTCQEADYDFDSDIVDVLFDATDGNVRITVE